MTPLRFVLLVVILGWGSNLCYLVQVVFEPKKQLYVEPYEQCEGLGRVAVMDSNSLIMLGRVSSVTYAE